MILTSALSEAPTVHQQTHDAGISTHNMDNAALEADISADNHGRTHTETSDRQYQALLLDPHDYDYPNLAEITRPRNPPAGSHADNARDYLELTEDSNGQQNIAMTTVRGPEYDDVTSPSSHMFTDDDMVLTDNQTYLSSNSVQYENT